MFPPCLVISDLLPFNYSLRPCPHRSLFYLKQSYLSFLKKFSRTQQFFHFYQHETAENDPECCNYARLVGGAVTMPQHTAETGNKARSWLVVVTCTDFILKEKLQGRSPCKSKEVGGGRSGTSVGNREETLLCTFLRDHLCF